MLRDGVVAITRKLREGLLAVFEGSLLFVTTHRVALICRCASQTRGHLVSLIPVAVIKLTLGAHARGLR